MKKSEKRLAIILSTLLGGCCLIVLFDMYFDKRDRLLAEKSALEIDWVRIDTLLEDRQMWEIRSHWLEQNQPKTKSTDEIDQALFEEVSEIEKEGVLTSNQKLLPSQSNSIFTQAGVSLQATGELPDLFRWLHELEEPGSFRVIRNLKATPSAEEPSNLTLSFQLLRWYAPLRP